MIINIPDNDVETMLEQLKRSQNRNPAVQFIVNQIEKLRQDKIEVTKAYEAQDVARMEDLVDELSPGFWRFQAMCFVEEFNKKKK